MCSINSRLSIYCIVHLSSHITHVHVVTSQYLVWQRSTSWSSSPACHCHGMLHACLNSHLDLSASHLLWTSLHKHNYMYTWHGLQCMSKTINHVCTVHQEHTYSVYMYDCINATVNTYASILYIILFCIHGRAKTIIYILFLFLYRPVGVHLVLGNIPIMLLYIYRVDWYSCICI